jgi:hypothetical protein
MARSLLLPPEKRDRVGHQNSGRLQVEPALSHMGILHKKREPIYDKMHYKPITFSMSGYSGGRRRLLRIA